MILGLSNYNEVEVNNFEPTEKAEVGGHICKILGVEIKEVTSQKDMKTYSFLEIKFDFDKSDRQADLYSRRYKQDQNNNSENIKWKGIYKVSIPTKDSNEWVLKNYKTFLTSINDSNEGINIDGSKGFDENILVGKLFGGVFGLKQLQLDNGKIIEYSELRFARKVENITLSTIPKVKLLDGTYMEYDDYIENKENTNNTKTNTEFNTVVEDEDLPF